MEYTALYRRFRPTTFGEIVGQEHITTTLRHQVMADRVGHAYLFTGCRGCGKTTSAKVLARAVNCLNPKDGEPCNECSICKAALDGSLTDIVEMDAASNNSVDDIRAIRDEVNFLPTVAKYRVYIIDEVHMLSPGAFNALLKTLEEPPKHVKFILATTEPQKLPATILSRCQRFDFKKISEPDITKNLEKVCKECNIEYSEDALNLIAELSEGAMRDALSILERCSQGEDSNITEQKVKDLVGIPKLEYISGITKAILEYDVSKCLEISNNIILEGKDLTNFLWEIIKYIRDIMILKTTGNVSNIYSADDKKTMEELTKDVSKDRLLQIIYTLSDLENELKWSSQKNIIFQVGMMRLCSRENMSLAEKVDNLEQKLASGNFTVSNSTKSQGGSGASHGTNNNMFSTSSAQNVDKVSQNMNKSANISSGSSSTKESSAGAQSQNSKGTSGANANFWPNVINKLKEERKAMLFSNLNNTSAVMLDDMTVGIQFANGLNSFGRAVIERPENMNELKRLVSMECGKDMRIKIIDNHENKKAENSANKLDLGININYID